MLSLAEVRSYLNDALRDDVADQDKLNTWFDQLFSEAFGQALAMSLYIDLINESLDRLLVVEVINRMTFPDLEARAAFTAYPEDEREQLKYLCKHKAGTQPIEDDDQYVRVMKLTDMIEYYLRPALISTSSSYEAQKEALDKFVLPPRVMRKGLGIVTVLFRGGRMNVWVASKKELDAALSATGGGDGVANLIRDRFGLYDFSIGTLVYVCYPLGFREGAPHIPTTMDISQYCQFYVSNTLGSEWGLTCGLNPASQGFQERVHSALGSLTDEFSVERIGVVDVPAIPDTEHLLAEALRRAT